MDFMLSVTFYVYIAAIIAYVVREVWRTKTLRWVAFGVFSGAIILNTILVISRWIEVGHVPASGKYESFVFFAWTIALVYLIMELVTIFIARVHESRFGIIGILQCVLSTLMLYFAVT
ncbi:MAG: hypothetical protein ACUZ8I_14335, partial [Candidatus Scalindua sp.]